MKLVYFLLGIVFCSVSYALVPRRFTVYDNNEDFVNEFKNFEEFSQRVPIVTNKIPSVNDRFPVGTLWLNTNNNTLYVRFSISNIGWRAIATSAP